jgi:hypothetical protein
VHKKADLNQPTLVKSSDPKSTNEKLMQNQFISDSCMTCHPQPHRLQRLLAEGLKRENVPATPGFHFKVSATCMACHLESQVTDKGEKVLKASANSCVACHKGRENLLNEWKADLEREIKFTKEVEQEALDALAPAKLSEPKLAEAKKMMAEGKENLNFVQFGNGVHNKKYSLFVLDAAITRFEDVLDFIEENQQ